MVTVAKGTGTFPWLLQRVTAVVMAVYTVVLTACLLLSPPGSFVEWKALFSGTTMRIATLVFFAALLYHAWVGMRDIVMDYVKPDGLRQLLELAVGAALLSYLIWAVMILWR